MTDSSNPDPHARAAAIADFTRATAAQAGGEAFTEWWISTGVHLVPRHLVPRHHMSPEAIRAAVSIAAEAWKARFTPSSMTLATREQAFNMRDPAGFFITHALETVSVPDQMRLLKSLGLESTGRLELVLEANGVRLDAGVVLKHLMDSHELYVRREAIAMFEDSFGQHAEAVARAAEQAATRVREAHNDFLRDAARRLDVELPEDYQ